MAIKQYQSYTLTDNWFEERAPKLNGVIGDYKERCFDTTASQAFVGARAPVGDATAATKLKAAGSASLGMAQLDTWKIESTTRFTQKSKGSSPGPASSRNETSNGVMNAVNASAVMLAMSKRRMYRPVGSIRKRRSRFCVSSRVVNCSMSTAREDLRICSDWARSRRPSSCEPVIAA